MKRRRFLSWLSFSSLFTLMPTIVSSCASKQVSSNPTPPPTTNQHQDGFTQVGNIQELEANGSLSFKTGEGKDIVIIKDPKNPESLYALDSVCTHQGCNVNWDNDNKSFFCPCHGSKFDAQGNVTNGPAKNPIQRYQTKVEGSNIFVKSS